MIICKIGTHTDRDSRMDRICNSCEVFLWVFCMWVSICRVNSSQEEHILSFLARVSIMCQYCWWLQPWRARKAVTPGTVYYRPVSLEDLPATRGPAPTVTSRSTPGGASRGSGSLPERRRPSWEQNSTAKTTSWSSHLMNVVTTMPVPKFLRWLISKSNRSEIEAVYRVRTTDILSSLDICKKIEFFFSNSLLSLSLSSLVVCLPRKGRFKLKMIVTFDILRLMWDLGCHYFHSVEHWSLTS